MKKLKLDLDIFELTRNEMRDILGGLSSSKCNQSCDNDWYCFNGGHYCNVCDAVCKDL